MSQDETLICLGAIAGAYGVRGDVRLKSFCAVPEDVAAYGPVQTEDGAQRFEVTLGSAIKTGFAAQLSGVLTKEQADALKGTRLYVDRAQLPNLPDDEYYYSDLIGLQVFDTGGQRIGRIKDVANHGATDLLEVLPDGRSDTVPVPFTQEVVPTVDLASGRVVVDAPEGLFPEH